MLNNSFILDSRATYYVYNNKLSFMDFRLPIDDNVLYISESVILIKGFGIVLVIITTLEELKQYTVYLYNVVLILLFYISIASLRLFIVKGVYWDIENLQLTYAKGTRNFCLTSMIYN